MSRDWEFAKFINIQDFWIMVDETAAEMELKSDDALVKATGPYKMLLLGRREMLDKLIAWAGDNEITLGKIAETWGLGSNEE